jgi:hypothetical protein
MTYVSRSDDMTSDGKGATAIANQLTDANLFDITGPIRINYSSSSIRGGVPLVSYKDADLDLNFQDDEITRSQTPLGELVTVTLDNVVDAFTRTFTLVVPSIRLPRGQEVEFTTLGVETTDRSGALVPPPGPSGVLHTYQVYQLRGTAQHVEF